MREWLNTQAAGGIVTYDPESDALRAAARARARARLRGQPVRSAGLFEAITATIRAEERLIEAFRTGEGVGWGEHDHGVFHGVERLFAPGYRESSSRLDPRARRRRGKLRPARAWPTWAAATACR